MAKGATYEADLLKLLLNATPIALVADNTVTTPLVNVFVALHTADPGSGGNQTTNEANYTSYARVAVARSGAGWTISGSNPAQAVPAATISFPACTGLTNAITHFSVGSLTTGGAGKIFYSGTVTPNISVSNGVTPQLTTATTITEL